MTKIYVIMGNDFPSGVVSTKANAERIVKEKMDRQKEKGPTRIYWRWYKFVLDGEME